MFALTIMQHVKCDDYDEQGVRTLCNFGYVENSAFAFAQMGRNHALILLTFADVVNVGLFNAFGLAVTKYGSASGRCAIGSSRTAVIWLSSVLLKFEPF